jgi:ribosomal-protein-alanine N-acetyltransferase
MPETLDIRPAVPGDAPRLAEIERAVATHPWSLSQFINSLRGDGERILVAASADGPLGFAVYAQVMDEGTLLNIAVAPAHQGRGIGRTLLDAVLQSLASDGAMRCLLEVRVSNRPALELYRAEGFLEDGSRKGYYPTAGGREDALLMSRALEATA